VSDGWQSALGADRLVVSGFGRWGGGVYDLTSGWPEALDDLATSGLAVGGGRVWRLLRAPGEQTGTCELLSYDERGVRSYQRLDAVRDPHDACWHGGALHVTSSRDDTVWRLNAPGSGGTLGEPVPVPVWRAGSPAPDAWHINSLTVVDGRLHACAFGRSGRTRAWKSGPRDTGFVLDLTTGEEVLSGLRRPHAPRFAPERDRWYVCESSAGTLTELSAAGEVLRRAEVKRFTRGLALAGGYALVGGNAHRAEGDRDRSEVVVVDLDTFEVADRIGLPCQEIYDIVAVPPELARGLATGFAANAVRAVEQHNAAGRPTDLRPAPSHRGVRLATPAVAAELAAMGEPVPPEDTAAYALHGVLPTLLRAGTVTSARLVVANSAGRPLGSVPPHPVRVGACWFPVGDDEPLPNPAVPVPHVVWPGEAAEVVVPLEAPDEPGLYELRVALQQGGVGWFGVRVEAVVQVMPQPPDPG
jgi:hypothetical protein